MYKKKSQKQVCSIEDTRGNNRKSEPRERAIP